MFGSGESAIRITFEIFDVPNHFSYDMHANTRTKEVKVTLLRRDLDLGIGRCVGKAAGDAIVPVCKVTGDGTWEP